MRSGWARLMLASARRDASARPPARGGRTGTDAARGSRCAPRSELTTEKIAKQSGGRSVEATGRRSSWSPERAGRQRHNGPPKLAVVGACGGGHGLSLGVPRPGSPKPHATATGQRHAASEPVVGLLFHSAAGRRHQPHLRRCTAYHLRAHVLVFALEQRKDTLFLEVVPGVGDPIRALEAVPGPSRLARLTSWLDGAFSCRCAGRRLDALRWISPKPPPPSSCKHSPDQSPSPPPPPYCSWNRTTEGIHR